jgi:hypothetical protein
VDIRIGGDPGLTLVRNERRDHARDDQSAREVSPGVIVELGRPVESAGTYNARGVLEGPGATAKGPAPPAPGAPVGADRVRTDSAAPPASTPIAMAETLRVPSNAQMQTLASASPQVAVALRAGLPSEAAHLHLPAQALTAGIQTLAASALKQAEKSHATQEHDEETDPLRKEKDKPVREGGKRRPR